MSNHPPYPLIGLALPGQWLQFPIGDRAREDKLIELTQQFGEDGSTDADNLRTMLDDLADAGGDQIFLRQDQPARITIVWPPMPPPPELAAGGQDAIQALRVLAGEDAEPIQGQPGYLVVRHDERVEDQLDAAYWLVHPTSTRILRIDVAVPADQPDELDRYDAVVADISWDDEEPPTTDPS